MKEIDWKAQCALRPLPLTITYSQRLARTNPNVLAPRGNATPLTLHVGPHANCWGRQPKSS